MDYNDEICQLESLAEHQRKNNKMDPITQELVEGLIAVLRELSKDLEDCKERLTMNEDLVSSMGSAIFELQTGIKADEVKAARKPDADFRTTMAKLYGINPDEYVDAFGSGEEYEEEEEEESEYIRCPFCNTLILGGYEADEFVCPFCGNSFTRADT